MQNVELGVRRKALGQFESIDEAEQYFRDAFGWSSRIDTSPPTYSTCQFVYDDLGQAIDFSEEVYILALPNDEYILEYRPSKYHKISISRRPPEPLLTVRPEIAALAYSKPDAEAFIELKFHFPGEAEAVLVAGCIAKWSHNKDIFAGLLKLFFRAPRWPVIALALLPEEVLLQNVEAEGCPLNFCAFSALRGESEPPPFLYQRPADFPDELLPISQPIPDVKLGESLGWTYLGVAPLISNEDFSRIWFDIWGRNNNLDDRAQLPVNFWREGADYD